MSRACYVCIHSDDVHSIRCIQYVYSILYTVYMYMECVVFTFCITFHSVLLMFNFHSILITVSVIHGVSFLAITAGKGVPNVIYASCAIFAE